MGFNLTHHLIAEELGRDVLEKGTQRILADEGVKEVISVEVGSRVLPDMPPTTEGQPTVLIVARWEDGSSATPWERAVRRAKRFVDAKRLEAQKLHHLDIAVEMIAEELARTKYLSLVPAQLLAQGLEKDWPVIKERVFQILQSHSATKGHTTSIGLFRLGFSPCDSENPDTVYVSVGYESQEADWPPVVDELQQYLRKYKHADLHLHLEHGGPQPYQTFPLVPSGRGAAERAEQQRLYNLMPDTPYNTAVNLGADICTNNYLTRSDDEQVSPPVGTLGCWLEIRTDRFPKWTKVALTNWHVVRPGYEGFRVVRVAKGDSHGTAMQKPKEESTLWQADIGGIGPSSNGPKIEHPARMKHNFGVEELNDYISTRPGEDTRDEQNERDQMVAFFDQGKHVWGTVYCASGYTRRTPGGGLLDWALILPRDASRAGKNALPSKQDWRAKYAGKMSLYPTSQTSDTGLRQPSPAGLRALEHGGNVYKVGASTRFTIGSFNCIKSDILITEAKHVTGRSEEFVFVASVAGDNWDCRLATLGDSGSVVWDKEGQAVGLLFRGQQPQQTQGHPLAYVTPIEDVFADIKEFSNGKIHEIRIAED